MKPGSQLVEQRLIIVLHCWPCLTDLIWSVYNKTMTDTIRQRVRCFLFPPHHQHHYITPPAPAHLIWWSHPTSSFLLLAEDGWLVFMPRWGSGAGGRGQQGGETSVSTSGLQAGQNSRPACQHWLTDWVVTIQSRHSDSQHHSPPRPPTSAHLISSHHEILYN